MKQILTIASVVLLFAACAQETASNTVKSAAEMPEAVMQSFQKAYPNATKVAWSVEGERFQVDFEENEMEREVLFARDGAILMTETEIESSDLPEAVMNVIMRDYPEMEIAEVERMTKGDQVLYEVELGEETGSLEIVYGEDGTLITINEEGEDDDEDDNEKDNE